MKINISKEVAVPVKIKDLRMCTVLTILVMWRYKWGNWWGYSNVHRKEAETSSYVLKDIWGTKELPLQTKD